MSTEHNKTLIRRFYQEATDQGNMALVDELFDPGFAYNAPGLEEPLTREGFKQFLLVFRAAFPDFHHTLDDLIAEGDTVVSLWTARATHRGVFQGIQPTNKPIAYTGVSIFYFEDGTVRRVWTNFDNLGMLQQLGALPAPPA